MIGAKLAKRTSQNPEKNYNRLMPLKNCGVLCLLIVASCLQDEIDEMCVPACVVECVKEGKGWGSNF